MNPRKVKTILLVEDDEPVRSTLVQYLENQFHVHAVGSAESAIQATRELQCLDLLLTDFDLRGDLDGLDVANATRKRDSNIPIVLITGSGHGLPRVRELLSLSRTTWLAKPFRIEELDSMIGSFFENSQQP